MRVMAASITLKCPRLEKHRLLFSCEKNRPEVNRILNIFLPCKYDTMHENKAVLVSVLVAIVLELYTFVLAIADSFLDFVINNIRVTLSSCAATDNDSSN